MDRIDGQYLVTICYYSLYIHLVYIDTMIQGPHSLEIVLHTLFQFFGDLMQYEKILEIPQFCLVQRSSRVNSLNNCSHVTKDHGMHQSCSIHDMYNVEIIPICVKISIQIYSVLINIIRP